MSGLEEAVADVLAALEGAGVHAVDDIRNINPPCAYVIPPDGAFRFDRHRVDVAWVLYLVVGNTGTPTATRALGKLVDQLTGVLPFTTFARDAVNNPDGGDPLPAYRVSWTSTAAIGESTP